jgi:hypothetical protein
VLRISKEQMHNRISDGGMSFSIQTGYFAERGKKRKMLWILEKETSKKILGVLVLKGSP